MISLLAIVLTLIIYVMAKRLYVRFKWIVFSPIILTPLVIMFILKGTHISYDSYKNNVSIINLLLGPATVAFAIPMYKSFHLLKKYRMEIILSVTVGTVIAVCSSLLLAILFHLQDFLVHSIVPRSITTPIAMDVSKTLGGDPSVTVLFVILTGIAGATIGPILIRFLALRSSIAKGLLMGVAAHGTGTAKAFEFGQLEGTFSSLAMISTAIITIILSQTFIPLLFHIL